MRDIKNKGVRSSYEISKKYEAGIILKGFEVKAILESKGRLNGAYVKFINNEPYLSNFELPIYSKANKNMEYNPRRDRKLLLNKSEITSLNRQVKEKNYTIIPMRIYRKNKFIKVEVALARGKKLYERKRDQIDQKQKLDLRRLQKSMY